MQRVAVRILGAVLSGSLLTGGSYLIANGLVAGSSPTLAVEEAIGGVARPASDGQDGEDGARVTASAPAEATATPDATPTPAPSVSTSPPPTTEDAAQVVTEAAPAEQPPAASTIAPPTPEPATGPGRVELRLAATPDYHGTAYYVLPAGQSVLSDTLELTAQDVDLDACSLTHRAELDDAALTVRTTSLPPQAHQPVELADGAHAFVVRCASQQGTVSADYSIRVADRQPKRCKDATFTPGAVTTASLGELREAMTGSWEGCVTTPWLPPYWVSIQFRPDGTYSAVSDEVLDGQEMNAVYYGMEADHPDKRYAVDGMQDGVGTGTIDVVFDVGTVNRDSLRNIRVMGDQLSFEMFHHDAYGPLIFELHRR